MIDENKKDFEMEKKVVKKSNADTEKPVEEIKVSYKPLNPKQMEMLVGITMLAHKGVDIPEKEMEADPMCQIMLKRIKAFNLPEFKGSAIVALSLLAEGNPGRGVMAMMDTMREYDKRKPEKIDVGFVSEFVYPFGYYTEESFEALWDSYKEKPESHPYSKLIC